MVVRWTFLDPTNSSTAEFEVNPNDMSIPPYTKNITSEATVAPGGATLFWEGARASSEITWSGVILTQSYFNLIVTWFNKRHTIVLTDELGISYNIYVKHFEAKRSRKGTGVTHPWRHEYTVTAIYLP